MTEPPFEIPPATPEQILTAMQEAHRAEQIDQAVLARALADPESSRRYHENLQFRWETEMLRQLLRLADDAMADEDLEAPHRNQVLARIITGHTRHPDLTVAFGPMQPIPLPHGPFVIIAEPIPGAPFLGQNLTVRCSCDAEHKWRQFVPGGDLLLFLSGHAPSKHHPAYMPPQTVNTGVDGYDYQPPSPTAGMPTKWEPMPNRIPRKEETGGD